MSAYFARRIIYYSYFPGKTFLISVANSGNSNKLAQRATLFALFSISVRVFRSSERARKTGVLVENTSKRGGKHTATAKRQKRRSSGGGEYRFCSHSARSCHVTFSERRIAAERWMRARVIVEDGQNSSGMTRFRPGPHLFLSGTSPFSSGTNRNFIRKKG